MTGGLVWIVDPLDGTTNFLHFAGRDIGIEHTGVVAGNPAIHEWLLETLKIQ